jgi:IclR family transcriptional regulator, acetate operon repressor
MSLPRTRKRPQAAEEASHGEAVDSRGDAAREDGARLDAGAPGTGLVVKALNLIDLIAADPGRHRAQSLAVELGLPRSTVYRIIATLQQRGLVRTESAGQGYYPGFKFLDYAQAVWPVPDLPMLAMAEMRWLRELTGETVYFGVPGAQDMIIIQKAESRFAMRSAAPLGSRRPLHCSGMGKAHLAALPVAARDAMLARLPLERATDRTITDPVQFRSQLDVYRLRGYAIDDEEFMEGVRCVSAAVPADGEGSLGALTISGPTYRMTPERAHQLGPEVAAAARRLGDAVRRRTPGRQRQRPGSVKVPEVADLHAFLGRAPAWDPATGSLLWLDALAPALMASAFVPPHGPAPTRILARFAAPAMAMLPREEGWLVLTAAGAVTVSAHGETAPAATALPPAILPLVISAVADDGDRLWIGTGDGPGAEGGAGLGLLDPAGYQRVADLAAAPTGLALDRAGGYLYAALSDAGEIVRFRLEGDGLGPLEVVSHVDPIHGRPAALLLEEPDMLWVALWDGWSIARLTRGGEDMRLLPLPVPRPTGLAFGGPERDVLLVTSARTGLAPQQIAEAPSSGGVFAFDRTLRASLLR